MEKLYELAEETDFDLIVVDTPPTRNALDFLDAPGPAHPLPRPPALPADDGLDRGVLRAVNVADPGLRAHRRRGWSAPR